eukprot:CAMPEP_0194260376 /NCGR_PEP_ID=MMETSP0158-20130606/45479_1 /TAXON_ID=33649 /ORGANISM="Thalassionema nitzschioides, Strain L26-B" /LENGTH=841 /DNA_ID=CAMNT_0039000465 /DNA_START=196 /DNA_END=2721 /DNA_ORIENTATION=-
MDSSEDHGDYVSESLSSFLKEADKNLAEATALMNSQFKKERIISPGVQSLDDDDSPTTFNPAAELDTPQAKALAFEGASPARSRKRATLVVKTLFSEDVLSATAEMDEMLIKECSYDDNVPSMLDESTLRNNESFCSSKTEKEEDATSNKDATVETSPSRSVISSMEKQELSSTPSSSELTSKNQTPIRSSSKKISANNLSMNSSMISRFSTATDLSLTDDKKGFSSKSNSPQQAQRAVGEDPPAPEESPMESPLSNLVNDFESESPTAAANSPQQAQRSVGEDSPVPAENPKELQMPPRRSPLSNLVNDFESESPTSADAENQTPSKSPCKEISANNLNMDNAIDLQLSPIPCISSKGDEKERTSSKKAGQSKQISRAFRKDSPVSKENPTESRTSPRPPPRSSPGPLSPVAIDAMSRARERVRQRKLAEQKRKGQLESKKNIENKVTTRTAQNKSMGTLRQKQLQIDGDKKAPDKRHQRVAKKLLSSASGSMISKPPRVIPSSKWNHSKLSPTSISSRQSSVYEPRPTVSSAKKTRSKLPPSAAPRRSTLSRQTSHPKVTNSLSFHYASTPTGKKTESSLAESTQSFGKYLRDATHDSSKTTLNRPRVTTPKPFKFHESRSSLSRNDGHEGNKPRKLETMAESMNDFGRHLRETPVPPKRVLKPTVPISPNFTPISKRERVPRKTETMAESVSDFGRHFREIPVVSNRDFSKPTIPVSPKFSKMPMREKAKSTADKEQEVVDYYNTHRFKAAPILTESHSSLPKNIPKKKLTVPKPFKFSSSSRTSSKTTHVEDESQSTSFRARPVLKSYTRGSSRTKECNNLFRERTSQTFNSRLGIR